MQQLASARDWCPDERRPASWLQERELIYTARLFGTGNNNRCSEVRFYESFEYL